MTQQKLQTIALDALALDSRLQARVGGVNERVAREYADALQNGDIFPPVTAFDDGERLWLASGYHRVQARRLLGILDIDAIVRKGVFKEALLFALLDNARHGLPRTDEDKRHAVEVLLADPEWCEWSTNSMAQKLNLSWGFVDRVRAELNAKSAPIIKFQKNNVVKTMAVGRRGLAATALYRLEPQSPLPSESGSIKDEAAEPTAIAPAKPPAPPRQVRRDASGFRIPESLARVFGDSLHFEAPAQIDRLMAEFAAASRWSKWLRLRELLDALADARLCIVEAQPHLVHRECKGRGCPECRRSGYLSRWAADNESQGGPSLPEEFAPNPSPSEGPL